jgi:hypothetical protein
MSAADTAESSVIEPALLSAVSGTVAVEAPEAALALGEAGF